MKVFNGSREIPNGFGPTSVGLGIFDGVHLGHQALLNFVRLLAKKNNTQSVAYTFHPHPAKILSLEHAPKLIEPLTERLCHLGALELDATLIEPFDQSFAGHEPEDFVKDVLVNKLRAKQVVVGKNFTFGRQAAGNLDLLKQMGQELNFEVHAVDLQCILGTIVSSTEIRKAVERGAVELAANLLGRPFSLVGTIEHGAGRGTGIGIPTANLHTENELLPKTGIYATLASGPFGQNAWGATNIGYSPTFGVNPLRVETFLLNAQPGNIYDQPLSVAFISRLRDELRFNDTPALLAQIHQDIEQAKKILSEYQASQQP